MVERLQESCDKKTDERMNFSQRSVVHLAGFGMALCYAALTWASHSESVLNLAFFYACIAMAGCFYCLPLRVEFSKSILSAVFLWSIVFRLLGLLGNPLFEDDFYRYLWDGYQFIEQGNPYLYPPEYFFADTQLSSAWQLILGNINYPEIPTIYGPSLQFLFALAYLIAPAEIWPLKVILIGLDMVLIVLLFKLGSIKNGLLYAWNPLVIKEIAFTGHIDGLIPLLVIVAWLCQKYGHRYWMAISLGIAVTIKIPALLIVPFLIWKSQWQTVMVFLGTILVCYVPFVGDGDFPILFSFAQNWQYNSAIFALFQFVFSNHLARYLSATLILIWLAILWNQHRQDTLKSLPRGDLVFAGLILLAPVINPWYWLWVLPFCVIYPNRWAWITSFSLLLSYICGININGEVLQAYQQPLWVPWLEFGIIGFAIYCEYLHKKSKLSTAFNK